MRRVSIQKVIVSGDRSIVSLGSAYEGWEERKPTVGERYWVFGESFIFKTSVVVNLQKDGYFETQNSLYKFKVLDEAPSDLKGEEDPRKSQEIIIEKGTL